ncbi:MAG: tRNA (adenosine(37)-N6)-dimethylallyltransferase MiaA [Elusimicrobiaceae bacterium]|nr:tRNA (adenosine(37)-N6)-dimethylallyltransferase MiaA [Elusimicrobiaceae bacterium]
MTSPRNPDLRPIVIMGPTASGKTELALETARECGGEVISADSRQVYRLLSAGTAKPPGQWRDTPYGPVYFVRDIACHLVDFLDPQSSYDTMTFIAQAKKLAQDITARGKTPIFAGGTGMYIQAYWNGLDDLPEASPEIRERLHREILTSGNATVHARLASVDPAAAAKIPAGNTQRLIRALEVHELTGRPISAIWTRGYYGVLPTHEADFLVIEWDKEILHARIHGRTKQIFEPMLEETAALLNSGCPADCPALKSLGYPQALDCINNGASRPDAIHKITSLTQSYAKRQMTWLRRYQNVPRIRLAKPEDWDPARLAAKIRDNRENRAEHSVSLF